VVTTATPGPGATATVVPVVISATFDDAATMTTAATMTLDGVKVAASFDYPVGYWYNDPDGCEPPVWRVTDATVGRMTFSAPSLPDGSHDATVTMRNVLGEATVYAWSFKVAVTPRVTAVSPVPGAVVVDSTDPTMVIDVADNSTSISGTLTLDGAAVTTTWDSANMRFLYKPSPPFSPISSHSATMTLSDADGHTSSYRWTFRILTVADVTFSGRTPASGTVLSDWSATVGARADDADYALQASAPSGVSVDGVPVPTGFWYPNGWWDDGDGCYEPVWRVTDYTMLDLSASAATITDGPHVVGVFVRNAQGVSAQTTWPITIAAPPRAYGYTPGFGTTTTTPLIRATVADNGPGSPNVTMSVDGTVVASTYDPVTRLVSYTPAVPLSDDSTHTVWLQMRDVV
jgi:hypothetical protein